MTENDKKFMRRAIALAEEGMNTGAGGPFGAVVVKDGEIIAEGWNIVTSSNDPTGHAEITAIRRACENLNTFQLEDCVLYTSCEPCPMCLGAIYWARPKKVYYALNHSDAAKIGFDDQFIYEELDKDIENRKVPFENILRNEGLPVFEKWDQKENRIDY
ncbi:nucleoside deaminase [Zunongwangia atlantica]|uniref:Guanine deaminase n=1 Tax=Zunongwangia atlantica 22II14-10F7 TaxID=1185767 RepID=A0A1Y1T1G0_9FLAO|nr:nucleoside deaminase [Zunongwangia atlantica]ORL44323.1 guanine deaminase [Zunongwangia atlantica 22II14-10F7]